MNPYLSFNGDCEAAFTLYEKCLGGKIEMSMTYAGSPMADQVPAEWGNKILHVTMSLGDLRLQGADAPPGRYEKPQGFSVALNLDDAAQASRIFKQLADGGTSSFRCRRPSGQQVLACSPIASAFPGSSIAPNRK